LFEIALKQKKIQSLFCTDLSPKYLLKVKEIVAGMHTKVLKSDSIFQSRSPSWTSRGPLLFRLFELEVKKNKIKKTEKKPPYI